MNKCSSVRFSGHSMALTHSGLMIRVSLGPPVLNCMHAWDCKLHMLPHFPEIDTTYRPCGAKIPSWFILLQTSAWREITVHELLQLYINKMSGLRHYLMKGTVAEALWESTFLTQILTLEWRSDAMCGKIRSFWMWLCYEHWSVSVSLPYITNWASFFHSSGHHVYQSLYLPSQWTRCRRANSNTM